MKNVISKLYSIIPSRQLTPENKVMLAVYDGTDMLVGQNIRRVKYGILYYLEEYKK